MERKEIALIENGLIVGYILQLWKPDKNNIYHLVSEKRIRFEQI